MGCRHAKGDICLILSNNCRCRIFNQDEETCTNRDDGIINYLKRIGTYDESVKNNNEYLVNKLKMPRHKKFIMDRFMKQN
ncbi:hypothetical protein CLPUN_46030 [Clostridium puniceum]|uniref:Uncharacterized protein n=1 Tax=Clostridium puniceum TaxID=29367 RepID=A0A1S8T547_9CLOT|nr:hypothetical protein [Clostridium puniceum]OOM72900.1 hypothetical protein CLPUN_46030 [Clostridium puniceum]